MTEETQMQELIERLEAATGADRDIDIAIARACPLDGWRVEHDGTVSAWDGEGWYTMPTEVPAYTGSTDAAFTMVPKGLVLKMTLCSNGEMQITDAWFHLRENPDIDGVEPLEDQFVSGPPAIAICIAALKARSVGTVGEKDSR